MKFRGIATRIIIVLGISGLLAGTAASWVLGSRLVRPLNRAVPLPAGFPAQVVSLPGPGHAIAGCWLHHRVNWAVVLQAVYPRVAKAVEIRIRIRVGPLAPVLAPILLVQLHPRLHVWPRDLEPIRSIAELGSPVLVVAGSLDEHTTLAESEELFGTAVPPKKLWVVRGARHQDFLSFDPTGYESEVVGSLFR